MQTPGVGGRRVVRGRRWIAATAVVVVTAALATGCTAGASGEDPTGSRAVEVPLQERHLPEVVNAPGTWSDEVGVDGPVAAVGIATRTRPLGLADDRQSLAVFAVSALDGSASWLRLPGFSLDRWGFAGGFDVSPDGEWIGWVRPGRPAHAWHSSVAGWTVMNTSTGRVRRLEDPHFPSVRGTMADLEFSGDSRYLLASYETSEHRAASRSHGHQLVAWDVETGEPTVVEPAGHYWLPNLGSAPTGVVWARGRTVFRADPRTGETTSVEVPQHVVTASWAPDDTAFAYIGRPSLRSRAPWRLYAGRDVAQARGRSIDLPPGVWPGQILGWVDSAHVVVGHYRRSVHVVDIVTGDVEQLDLAGYGDQVNAPYLAAALWQQPLVTPTEPESTTDPRRPWRWAGAGVLLVGVGGVLTGHRRRRRSS